MSKKKKVIIIGGIAAGTAAAAKCRRMDEELEIALYEKDRHISYGTCGLPYFVSGKISGMNRLLINTPGHFEKRFDVLVRTGHEVLKIFPGDKKIEARDLKSGSRFRDSYDRLILATGSDPIRIPIEGSDADNVFTLKTIKDGIKLKGFMAKKDKSTNKNAVIIGGGFIGLELIEAFMEYGYRVSIIEKMDQLLPAFDREIIEYIESYLEGLEIRILKREEAARLIRDKSGLVDSVETKGGKRL